MALTQVSTGGVKDGTILNADVSASAAIAGTKINPSFTSDIILTNANPSISLLDSDANSDFKINVNGGIFSIKDQTNVDATRLAIDSSGNVRIGSGAPATFGSGTTVLETHNANTFTANLVTSGTHQLQMLASQTHGSTSVGTRSNHNLNLCANDLTKVTITTAGNVGINQTNPSNLLHCSRTSTTAYSSSSTTNDSTVLLQNLGAAGHSTLEFQCKSSGTAQTGKATISATPEAASSRATSLTFGTRNASSAMEERMRITSTGKVNIGDTQMSSNLLNIEDGTAAAIDIASHGSGGDTAYIGVKKSTGGGLTFGISNRDIIFKTGATYNNGTTFDSGTERLRIATDGLITSKGDIRVDRGVTGVDGIVGQAYSGYFGLKHADQTINQEYMILNNGVDHTFISTNSGNSIYIRPDANSTVHETVFAINDTQFNTHILMNSHHIARNDFSAGFLVGAQNNQGASDAKTNPIFTIGTNHLPTNTALSDMYGIGYSHGNASFTPSGTGWGMYVAADGDARVYLDGSQGRIYFDSNLVSTPRYISSVSGDYGSLQINNGPKNGWSGYSIDGHTVFMSNGSASGDYIGIYDDNANSWVILTQRLSFTRLHHGGNPRLETTSAGVSITGTLTASSTKSFRIPHPLSELSETKDLVHAAIEGPQMDLMYRGKVDLIDGTAIVNIDTKSGMTEGTFNVLNRDVQCFTTNETGWTNVKGSITGNKLTIVAEDNNCTDTISWMVIGERKDNDVVSSEVTNNNGDLIVEPDKQVFDEDPKMDN